METMELLNLEDFKSNSNEFVGKKDHSIELTKNIVQFRNGFINLPLSKSYNPELAMSVVSELMQFGYLLNEEAIRHLSCSDENDIINFHSEVINYIKKMTGSNRDYTPFWKGFPQEVMEKTELELWMHQIIHYLSNGKYEPNEWTQERESAFEHIKYNIITAGNEQTFNSIFTDLVSVNQSLTPDDKEIIVWFVSNGYDLLFPDNIPFKENLCVLAAMGLPVPVKTVTDVLRIATHMSGGDISLPKVPAAKIRFNAWTTKRIDNPEREKFKFKNFSRKERKFLLSLIESSNLSASEAVLKIGRWIRLGEKLHPGDYSEKFPKAFKFFNTIRNEKVVSWYGELEKAFKEESFENALTKLSERPGEFFRRLDSLVRNNSEHLNIILEKTEEVAKKVSNKVLFESLEHFGKRKDASRNRTIMIKGSRKVTKLPDLEPLNEKLIESIKDIIINALSFKYSQLEKLGNVWIDEELKNIPMPKNMRSVSSSLKPIIRGQRTKIDGNKNTIRAFVHWFDERGSQDIDLTATFIGDSKIKRIGFNGDHNCKEGCYSGDVRHKQGECAEYIDINIKESIANEYRFVAIDARNYNGRSFETVTDCCVGYMEREFPKANKVFVPSTIKDCIRLTNESSTTICSVIDLNTREVIHLDIDTDGVPMASANVQELLDAIEPYCHPPKFSVFDLIMMHINSRGGVVCENKEDSEVSFEYESFSDSYIETLKLMGI
jgi:hypothetical protein